MHTHTHTHTHIHTQGGCVYVRRHPGPLIPTPCSYFPSPTITLTLSLTRYFEQKLAAKDDKKKSA